jgi:pyridoxamine 5'-phosphate oxidase
VTTPIRRDDTDPIATFQQLFARASTREPDATAVALATADATGAPSVRMVLLKAVDADGFVFFTNYESRKAGELDVNPRAALCLYWPTIGVQVRVEGAVERVTAAESEAYFATRPRESQLGAWASQQSRPLASADALREEFARTSARFAGQPVPRPPVWGGFRVRPQRIEFWHAGEHRLHERILYTRAGEGWTVERLFP